jgi:hypothetical protein
MNCLFLGLSEDFQEPNECICHNVPFEPPESKIKIL